MGLFNKKLSVKRTGDDLVADFQSAITNLLTMETANYAASQSEQSAIATINRVAEEQNSTQLVDKDYIIKSSLDAHVKKAQAENITQLTITEVTRTEEEAKRYFIGKKVILNATSPQYRPFESLWFDNKSGQYKTSKMSAKSIKGKIEDLSFEKNIIVVRPRYISRLVVSSRQAFIVKVMDLDSMQLLVSINIK
ncbi:MAG: hypothetical protein M3Q14_03815 [bacterium]|nr:hypothetical protein [bacterium]